ncbi:MAG TPA: quinone oxidoreductase, partial [Gemmatimonadetes bacterium]|nr:quinone oxidoreductase [Gemmatimonadota bacterium]
MSEKTRAIIVKRYGGPEVLKWQEIKLPQLGPTDVLVHHTAVGLNFIDVYHRTGLYPLDLPLTPGVDGAGIVEAVGSDVDDLGTGDRVAYTGNGPPGSYSERRILPRTRLARLPDAIDDKTAAAIMLKGCTVEYLVR